MATYKELVKQYGGLYVEPAPYGENHYRIIKGYEACNFDGEPAGYKPGTKEGDREVLERRFIPSKKAEKEETLTVRYTNFW